MNQKQGIEILNFSSKLRLRTPTLNFRLRTPDYDFRKSKEHFIK